MQEEADLITSLRGIVGDVHVLTAEADRRFFSHDIYGPGELAACVVQPGTVDELGAAVAAATSRGFAVVPRGGGSSYTGGYLPDRPRSVMVDARRLDRIVEVNTDDMYVTVECGITWKALYLALREKGVRTPFWGPLSGAVATVGGSLSQNAILWGSAKYGASAESVLGLEVVLADGSVVATGSAGSVGTKPFFRHYGPDLTGLFLGDTGALGIKARATLRLMRLPSAVETASFGFANAEDMTAFMTEVVREGLVSECFGMDPELTRQRMKRASLAQDVKALAGVVTSAKSLLGGVREAAKVVVAGRSFLDESPYSVHVGTEGRDEVAVRNAMAETRRVAERCRGKEVENTIPKVLRGDPFVSMTSAIGPEGERWAPIHGLLPLSEAASTWSSIRALIEEERPTLDRLGSRDRRSRGGGGARRVRARAGLLLAGAAHDLLRADARRCHPREVPRLSREPRGRGLRVHDAKARDRAVPREGRCASSDRQVVSLSRGATPGDVGAARRHQERRRSEAADEPGIPRSRLTPAVSSR
jgi:FAD/FMN-containing dehydrogenase